MAPDAKTLNSIEKHYHSLEKKLRRSAKKSVRKFREQEKAALRKMAEADSAGKSSALSANVDSLYQALALAAEDKNTNSDRTGGRANVYMPLLDSLVTLSGFLRESSALSPLQAQSLEALSSRILSLQQQLGLASDIKKFIIDRKSQLMQELDKLGMDIDLTGISKQVFYYQQELNEFKTLINQPDRAAMRLLKAARDLPAFRDYMGRHSQLAQLFLMPGMSDPGRIPAGLQTRLSVQQDIGSRMGTGVNAGEYLQQQVQQARNELNKWKDKINQAGGGSSEWEAPGFRPNNQKTKTFLQRIEWGFNVQSQRSGALLPVTTDLALMAGYKLSDRSTVGVGAAYKIGWGRNLSHIRITHQGVGLRSFADLKIKGGFWLSGGYELNYNAEFSRVEQLKNMDAWQRSALIGLDKKYSIGKKKGNLQLLWDFLSYSQAPRTQPLKFRIGYTF